MMRRLLNRNIATLVVVVLAGQLLGAALLYGLVLRPQTIRLAEVTAEMTDTIGRSMARMSPQERRALVSRFTAEDALLMRPGEDSPVPGFRHPTLIEDEYLAAISHRLNHGVPVEWRADRQSRLWIRLWLGGDDWWVSLTPNRLRAPLFSTLIALGSALAAAMAGGIALQRHIDRPLRRLAAPVDGYDADHPALPLPEDGPEEIAAVARAFNRMTARLAGQDAERALMLGAVSHDLRTPLTRLRLSLAMMHGADPDLLESAGRQVDGIEQMLGQFLDMARGFDKEAVAWVDVSGIMARAVADSGLLGAPQMAVTVPEGLQACLRPLAITRAVANLLGNAYHHGIPPWSLKVWPEGRDLIVEVGDAGEGFDPDRASELCRPFARGDSARGGQGAGLGLAIVANIIATMEGTLNFERSDGQFRAQLRLSDVLMDEK